MLYFLNSASKATSGWFQRQQSKSGTEEKEEKQKTNKYAKDRSDEAETNVTEASSESEPERLATTSEKLSDEDERKQDGEGDQIETSDEVRKPKETPCYGLLKEMVNRKLAEVSPFGIIGNYTGICPTINPTVVSEWLPKSTERRY